MNRCSPAYAVVGFLKVQCKSNSVQAGIEYIMNCVCVCVCIHTYTQYLHTVHINICVYALLLQKHNNAANKTILLAVTATTQH